MSQIRKFMLTAVLAAVASLPAHAAYITGGFEFTTGLVSVSASLIDWLPAGGGAGTFTMSEVTSGTFLGGTAAGTIKDMDPVTMPVGLNAVLPANGLNFITLGGPFSGITFVLDTVFAGTSIGPFSLSQAGPNVSAAISVAGTVYNSATPGDVSRFNATISTQYLNTTEQTLINRVLGGQTLETRTWSGSLNTEPIPEPASMLLSGAALLALGLIRRRTV